MSAASVAIATKSVSNAVRKLVRGKGLFQKHESQLSPADCTFHWKYDKSVRVGTQSELTVMLVRKNGTAYSLKVQDSFTCRVKAALSGNDIQHNVEPKFLVGQISVRILFTATIPDRYSVEVRLNGSLLGGRLATKTYTAGEMDLTRSKLLNVAEPKIATAKVYFPIQLFARDNFGNAANISENRLQVEVRKNSFNGEQCDTKPVVTKATGKDALQYQYRLCLRLQESGYYVGRIKYNGRPINPHHFAIICLTEKESQEVRMKVATRGRNASFKAKMTTGNKTEDVLCFINPQAFEVRRFKLFGMIQRQCYTCRVSPTRKVSALHKICHGNEIVFDDQEPDKFTLDNRNQKPIELSSNSRNMIAAMYYKFILQSVGGAEDFNKKKQYCCDQLRIHHCLSSDCRESITLEVRRNEMLKTAMRETERFDNADWLKRFEIRFVGELGTDLGGLNREFVELLSRELFSENNGFFARLDTESQQVHPNHCNRHYKIFEFAGKVLGKCILESTVFGNSLLVKAKFTRSFLAQLMGLNVDYSYYEMDDPVYFRNKIKYTLENDITGENMFFTDTSQDAPLIKNGQRKRVTEENKKEYLNELTHFRLAKRPRKQIKYLIKGLTLLIPSDLLMVFSEEELQLLMCGIDEINVEDMKQHTDVMGARSSSAPTLSWFWKIVEQFTQEEKGMLLQFVTGSSQLPQGGFDKLFPQFTIFVVHEKGRLPSAHTCTNQLDLPEFESCEQLHVALMTAITEAEPFYHC